MTNRGWIWRNAEINRNKRRDKQSRQDRYGMRVHTAARKLAEILQNKLRSKNGEK